MKRFFDYFSSPQGDHFVLGFGISMVLSAWAFTSGFWLLLGVAFVIVTAMTMLVRKHMREDDHERNN